MATSETRYGNGENCPNRHWSGPRPPLDPGMRRAIHGPIQSMVEDRERSLWEWLFYRN